jgi:GH15 family glucan-1,4-alpha-glucosidase
MDHLDSETGYPPIENNGVIGDLHTAALVGMQGSIDFLCFPHFDSPSIFAALLDRRRGGRFRLAPVLEDVQHKQLYLPDSSILLTRFLSDEGVAELSDFMVIDEERPGHHLVRRAKTVRGQVRYRLSLEPRFDYGRAGHRVEKRKGEVLFIPEGGGNPALRLRTETPVEVRDGDVQAEFVLRTGEHAAFVLEEAVAGRESLSRSPDFVPASFKSTLNFWRGWISRSNYRGRWREMVNRSALTLKLLTSCAHGSMVAAPTFGLPEVIGGRRNWDYRFTWIRDACFSLYALIRLGYTEEARLFMSWIEARCGELEPDGSLQTLYGIDGGHEIDEEELGHWEGYRGSSPVRIGNGAYRQLQLDIYGELMNAVYLYNHFGEPISHDLWTNVVRLLDWVCRNWRQEDEGIWESRGGRHEFLYSRFMCWVAVDRGIRLAHQRSFPAPLDEWLRCRDQIYEEIFRDFWHEGRRAFIQYKGSSHLDAANLLMPLLKFVSPTDPRWLSTLQATERELVDDSLVYRYITDDFLPGKEGTFSMCTFWYVECLARAGDVEKARFFFEKMLGYANHLGLYSEELGPRGEFLGNFPQAFPHLGLISAAYAVDRRLSAAGCPG